MPWITCESVGDFSQPDPATVAQHDVLHRPRRAVAANYVKIRLHFCDGTAPPASPQQLALRRSSL